MISSYDFVIFLSEDWDAFFRRYLLGVLAEQLPMSKVVCVDRPVCLVTTPLRDPVRWLKQTAGRDRLRKLSNNLFVYRPWVFLHDHVAAKLPFMPILNGEWLRRQLKGVINSLGLRQDRLIVWIYDPLQEECLGLVSECLSVYECYDEYSAWPGVPVLRTRGDLVAREERILGRVDVIFVVSEALYERKRLFNPNVHVISNAVDARHFGLARDESTRLAEDVTDISHPIIGYLGNLTDRINFALLLELARARAEWSLVLVGGTTTRLQNKASRRNFAILQQMPNVYLLGAKPYEKLPSYLKAFDVCLIPYAAADVFNVYCSPLKLYEYLATGKPIVSTDLPAVRPFEGLVRIARHVTEFEQQVAEALQEQGETLRQQRLAAAQENSWEKRVEEIIALIAGCL